MTLEITELVISSKKVLATQRQNAGIICQMRLRQKKLRWDNSKHFSEKTTIFVSYIYVCIQYFVYILLDFNCVIIYIIF